MKKRIGALDGLRFLAALGVLWIHTWTDFKNPRFYIGKIDFADFLAIGVNGVDLFFVISGFCMYYFYGSKNQFSFKDFYKFIIKRWIRLSPAFYFATIVYIILRTFVYHQKVDGLLNFLHSVFYLNYIFGEYNTASHFWTLTVEWQFYFTLPILLIYQNYIGFRKIFLGIYGGILLIAILSVFILKNEYDFLTGTILYHGIEFGFGVLVARLIIKNHLLLAYRAVFFVLFMITVYAGRVLISKPILNLSYYYYNLYRLSGFTLMGMGFSGILYLALTSNNRLKYFLGNDLFSHIGKISYSFYLWHALVHPVVSICIIEYLPYFKGIVAPVISTIISGLILYPISLISYKMLEKPYFSIDISTTK